LLKTIYRNGQDMIHVENLSYTYPSAREETLKGLNFKITQGEIFGFLGPSGAGKSTCQKILYKTLRNFSGRIDIQGKALNDWGREYFEGIGVGFELPNHYGKLTATENLELFAAFYPKEKRAPILPLLELVGLEHDAHKQVDTYSKGMKVRLNFVRAIMHDPDLLFLDEPTAGLDPINALIIKNHIRELKQQGKTIFITTHDMITADELCDRVSFIVEGEIIVTENPSELKQQYGNDLVRVELRNGTSSDFSLSQLGVNKEFLEFIKHDEILRIHSQESTLEHVFIAVTGRALKA
jgi:fluoroquinolone transport system ATP-binding protein